MFNVQSTLYHSTPATHPNPCSIEPAIWQIWATLGASRRQPNVGMTHGTEDSWEAPTTSPTSRWTRGAAGMTSEVVTVRRSRQCGERVECTLLHSGPMKSSESFSSTTSPSECASMSALLARDESRALSTVARLSDQITKTLRYACLVLSRLFFPGLF
jgi:hypothetical protein